MNHSDVRKVLYEFIRGDLTPADHQNVERHLGACRECRREAEELGSLLSDFPPLQAEPSDERPDAYWQSFTSRVEERLISEQTRPGLGAWAKRWFMTWMPAGRTPSVALVGAAAAILLSVGIWLSSGSPSEEMTPGEGSAPVLGVSSRQAVEEYFTASRMLLIGITNISPEEGEAVDLTLERTTAQSLVRQARLLAEEPLDERSRELIGELERILIELANVEQSADVPAVEIIRTGVRQQNLLFKIRMAEDQFGR